ncbi:glutathione S-transferase family protein [Granulosicoccus sp. 3-233]|uniref:glutathione S-transferase family protein n=1 Tax=Granulosicoccus sp. 3-233 TaxID=3417969 RepID=UPI003D329BF7
MTRIHSIHPFGKIPVLVHGDRHLIETPSICRYLDTTFTGPALQPEDPWLRAQVDQWTSMLALYVDHVIVRSYLLEFVFPKGKEGAVRQEVVDAAKPELARVLKLLDEQLAEGDYLVGDTFSIADAIAAPMLDYLSGLPAAEGFLVDLPRLIAYVDRLRKRPSAGKVLVAPTF